MPQTIPLVFVPGLMCDESVWAAQIESFGRSRCWVVDHADLDSLPAMASALLDRAPPSFALIGHSMGGRVALEVMRQASHRVTHLALLDTGFETIAADEAGERERMQRYSLLNIAQTRGMHAMAVDWAQAMVHPDRLSDTPFMQRIYDMISRTTPTRFAAQIRALLSRPDAGDVLSAIRCPTLVLCGRQDTWSPWSRHEEIARRVATSALVGIDRCGHMAPMEQPDEVTTALRELLDRT